jgi:hypothetical protein
VRLFPHVVLPPHLHARTTRVASIAVFLFAVSSRVLSQINIRHSRHYRHARITLRCCARRIDALRWRACAWIGWLVLRAIFFFFFFRSATRLLHVFAHWADANQSGFDSRSEYRAAEERRVGAEGAPAGGRRRNSTALNNRITSAVRGRHHAHCAAWTKCAASSRTSALPLSLAFPSSADGIGKGWRWATDKK